MLGTDSGGFLMLAPGPFVMVLITVSPGFVNVRGVHIKKRIGRIVSFNQVLIIALLDLNPAKSIRYLK